MTENDSKPRLRRHYDEQVQPRLQEIFGFDNPMEIPRLEKIVMNTGLGDAKDNPKLLDSAVNELAVVSGQRPVVTRSRKAISNFRLREGMPVGVKVTLRKSRMYEFLDRLVTIALPRVRDFRGLSPQSFDGRGNYALGIKEHIVFPEIDYDKVVSFWGMDVVVCTTAHSDDEARALLKGLNFPFRD